MKHDPASKNRLIANLSEDDRARLLPHLELVHLNFGAVLHDSNVQQTDVYFPTTATLSIVNHTAEGRSTAVATVGNDGLAGLSIFLGSDRSINQTVVQGAGYAYRMRSSVAKCESARGGGLQHFALRYALALMTEMAQTAACYRLHTTEQQLCRWLLLSTYHSECSTIVVTQRLIANALGTRREATAEAAAKLRSMQLINCGRGSVTVVNRQQLEAHGCECYASAKKEVDRLLPYRIQQKAKLRTGLLLPAENSVLTTRSGSTEPATHI